MLTFMLTLFLIYTSPQYDLYPGNREITCESFTESYLGGNSVIDSFTTNDAGISLNFRVGDSCDYPYTGITFLMRENKQIETHAFDQLRIEIDSSFPRVSLCLKYFLDGYSRDGKYHTLGTKENWITCTGQMRTYTLPLKDFLVPQWWYELNNLSRDFTPVEVQKPALSEITVQISDNVNRGAAHSLKIKRLYLIQERSTLFIGWGIFTVCYSLIILLFRYRPKVKSINKENVEKVMNYLNENFTTPEISIIKVSKDLKLTTREIEELLRYKFNKSFNEYLTFLRLGKAKEILLTTNNNISEIAYYLGYKYPSYFNRLFQRQEKLSPREYRKKNESRNI